MKILFFLSRLIQTGPTKQLYYILKHIDRNRFDPTIITLSPESHNSYHHLFSELDIPIRCLHLKEDFRSPRSSRIINPFSMILSQMSFTHKA